MIHRKGTPDDDGHHHHGHDYSQHDGRSLYDRRPSCVCEKRVVWLAGWSDGWLAEGRAKHWIRFPYELYINMHLIIKFNYMPHKHLYTTTIAFCIWLNWLIRFTSTMIRGTLPGVVSAREQVVEPSFHLRVNDLHTSETQTQLFSCQFAIVFPRTETTCCCFLQRKNYARDPFTHSGRAQAPNAIAGLHQIDYWLTSRWTWQPTHGTTSNIGCWLATVRSQLLSMLFG